MLQTPSQQLTIRQSKHERLESIARLKPNWDGYGAPAINSEIITQLRKLFLSLDDASLPARVVPTSDGGIQIEYEDGKKYLEIEFTPDGIGYLLQYDGFEEEREDAQIGDVTSLIGRFYAA